MRTGKINNAKRSPPMFNNGHQSANGSITSPGTTISIGSTHKDLFGYRAMVLPLLLDPRIGKILFSLSRLITNVVMSKISEVNNKTLINNKIGRASCREREEK